MRIVRSVNRLHVGNLGPSGIGGDSVEILVDVNTKTMNMYIKKIKKFNYSVFLLTWDCGFIPEMGDVTDIF